MTMGGGVAVMVARAEPRATSDEGRPYNRRARVQISSQSLARGMLSGRDFDGGSEVGPGRKSGEK